MKEKVQISATIVLYKEDANTLKAAVSSFLETPLQKKLFLIDNSPTDILRKEFNHPDISYVFVGKNTGFATAHNLIIDKIANQSEYHLILNPDVVFKPQVLGNLIAELKRKNNVSMISPKVIYPNGDLQYTCRKHPSILEMISRRLGIFKSYTEQQEYRNIDLSVSFYPDFIHGVFLLFKTSNFVEMKGFDEQYFLYMEDADICRKIEQFNKEKCYYPIEEVIHIHRKGSAKKAMLFYYHLTSAIKYFIKW